jgi:putative lipoprotein
VIPLAQLAAAAAIGAGGARPAAPAPADSARPRVVADRWLGMDKPKHFLVAGLVESVAFAAARMAGADRRPALGVGIGVGAAASIGKELVDRTGRGTPSFRDLAWDAAGMAAYGALLARTAR